jgi:anti-anti-sigma regulatory factor
MSIQDWSKELILVELPAEPQTGEHVREAIQLVRDRGDCDVVVDFSQVDIITDCEHKLTLCHIAPATKGIFSVTGLDDVFTVVDDKSAALATPQAMR